MRNRRTVCYAFCYSDEENGRCTCASGDLTTANQSEIRKAYLVSVVSGRKLEREWVSVRNDESLIFPQPSYDERIYLYPEKLKKGFIRFSVGLEDPGDIIRDLDQALQAVGL